MASLLSFGSIALLLLTVVAGFLAPGCRDETALPIDRNRAPETILTGAPGDSQTSFYRVHLYWKGSDIDGEVVRYEWAITESLPDPETIEYNLTAKSDSTFNLQVEPNREVLGHRFYVRAIDNEGKRDETPAWTFFAARNNCEPTVTFTRSVGIDPFQREHEITSTDQRTPTDTIPAGSSVRFAWRGFDCDVALDPNGGVDSVGHVTRYSHHLTPLEINDIEGTLADTTAEYDASRLRNGTYTMYVRAVDDAGFAGLDPTVRTFVWNYDPQTRWAPVPTSVGSLDSMKGYWADTTDNKLDDFVPIADGDTLPVNQAGLRIKNRVRAFDRDSPTADGAVAEYEARMVVDAAFWDRLGDSREFEKGSLYTLDGEMMCRSRDKLGREDGTPDTLRIYVNKAVRLLERTEIPDIGPFVQRPYPGERITRRLPPNSPGDTLVIKFFGVDPDPIITGAVEMRYRFASFPQSDGSFGTDSFYSEWIPQGVYWAQAAVFTSGRRRMLPGEYALEIQAREAVEDEAVGQRITSRTIRFTLVN